MTNLDLIIVGSIGIDAIETPFAKRTDLLGGSATYACAAASFFASTGMVGIVGDDFPEDFLARYRRFGIDLSGLQQVAGPTFRWDGVYADDFINRETRRTELGVFADFHPELPERYRDAPYVLLGNIHPTLQLRVLDQIRRPKLVAADTMDLWIRTTRDALLEVLARVDLLLLNDAEARQLSGRYGLIDCAEALLAMGPKHVIIKKGEHGAMLFSGSDLTLVPAFPVRDLRDPTGAGDTFAGALLGHVAGQGGQDYAALRRALPHASVVAAFGVEAFSLERLESLTQAQILDRLHRLREMIACPEA